MDKTFSVFRKSKGGKGPNLTKHFEKWGWVSFMVYVAENATIFYKQNGKSNIDNIKETKAYDVMIWSSEKKDMEENLNQYYESMS